MRGLAQGVSIEIFGNRKSLCGLWNHEVYVWRLGTKNIYKSNLKNKSIRCFKMKFPGCMGFRIGALCGSSGSSPLSALWESRLSLCKEGTLDVVPGG